MHLDDGSFEEHLREVGHVLDKLRCVIEAQQVSVYQEGGCVPWIHCFIRGCIT